MNEAAFVLTLLWMQLPRISVYPVLGESVVPLVTSSWLSIVVALRSSSLSPLSPSNMAVFSLLASRCHGVGCKEGSHAFATSFIRELSPPEKSVAMHFQVQLTARTSVCVCG